MWEPRRFTALWGFKACYRDSFTFYLKSCVHFETLILKYYNSFCVGSRLNEVLQTNELTDISFGADVIGGQ
jgi:hypothetical protein